MVRLVQIQDNAGNVVKFDKAMLQNWRSSLQETSGKEIAAEASVVSKRVNCNIVYSPPTRWHLTLLQPVDRLLQETSKAMELCEQ